MGRMILRGFTNGDVKPLIDLGLDGKKVVRVYTIIDENRFKFNPVTGKETTLDSDDAHLQHLENVFLEDNYHDWRVSGDTFSFYGHSGSKGNLHDLLIEYKDV
jgi:hypothetical protein